LLTGEGVVVSGANVENASFGLTICAERAAFVAAVSSGLRDFRIMAVFAEGDDMPYPCGACLQVAQELAPAIRFVVAGTSGMPPESLSLRDLLPRPFGLGTA
jgi:cytidine deaminase